MVAVAVIGAGALAAGSTVYAANQSASATQQASQTAANTQNAALAQQAALAKPYTTLGQSAIPQLQSLLGLNGANPLTALQNTPGYQFSLSQGDLGITNAASAAGGLSGNTLEALSQYNQGLAQNTYQQALGNTENVVGLGQAAAAGQAANIGNAATNLGNIAITQGTNNANIALGEAAGLSNILGSTAGQYATATTLQNLNNSLANQGAVQPAANTLSSYSTLLS